MRTRRVAVIEAEDPRTWLAGLPPEAQRMGHHLLEQYEVIDKERFRSYLRAWDLLDAIPHDWTGWTEAVEAAVATAVQRLHDPPVWWRVR